MTEILDASQREISIQFQDMIQSCPKFLQGTEGGGEPPHEQGSTKRGRTIVGVIEGACAFSKIWKDSILRFLPV